MDKCVRYLRVSTLKQDENNQIRAIDVFIKEKGWKLIRTYRDRLSAYQENVTRPDFERMIRDAEKREFQHIVVFDLDRFSRQPEGEVLSLIKNLRLNFGIEINSVFGDEWRDAVEVINNIPKLGVIGEATAEYIEKLIRGIQAQQARRESERISRRILESTKFQKARDEGRVGKPKLPDDVVTLVKALVEYNVPYKGIKAQVEYKNHKDVIRTPSEAAVSLIRKDFQKKNLKKSTTKN